MDNQNNKPYKPKVPLSDACEFYLRGFDTHASGLGQIKVTNRPPQFGVFFDGTGNNFSNDIARWDDDKEPTNVSKLHLLYPDKKEHFIGATYIPGVGTEANRDDSDLDMGMAYSFGDKVREAVKTAGIIVRRKRQPTMLILTTKRLTFSMKVYPFPATIRCRWSQTKGG